MKNPTAHPVQAFIANRWSPYAYDAEREVSEADLRSLFEAARWSMSSFNEQPWRYIVGVRGRTQATWDRVHDCLTEGNRGWTARVPVLALKAGAARGVSQSEHRGGTAWVRLGRIPAA